MVLPPVEAASAARPSGQTSARPGASQTGERGRALPRLKPAPEAQPDDLGRNLDVLA